MNINMNIDTNKININMNKRSYWDILPDEIQTKIIEHRAALMIQRNTLKMFYKNYGIFWEIMVMNYEEIFDYYCYRNNINDPWQDYINYYR